MSTDSSTNITTYRKVLTDDLNGRPTHVTSASHGNMIEKVTIDGQDITEICHAADSKNGYAIVYLATHVPGDKMGRWLTDGDQLVTVLIHGRVEIEWKETQSPMN